MKANLSSSWPLEPFTGPLSVDLTFHTQIPASWSKKRKMAAKYDLTKPDIDNYMKWVFDLMNEIIYQDDNQIVETTARKLYSTTPETIILIKKLET